MNAINNLKTSVRLIGSFLIIALVTAVVGSMGIAYIRQIDNAATKLYQDQTVPLSQLGDIVTAKGKAEIMAIIGRLVVEA